MKVLELQNDSKMVGNWLSCVRQCHRIKIGTNVGLWKRSLFAQDTLTQTVTSEADVAGFEKTKCSC